MLFWSEKMEICGLRKPDPANPDKIGHPAGLIPNPDERLLNGPEAWSNPDENGPSGGLISRTNLGDF